MLLQYSNLSQSDGLTPCTYRFYLIQGHMAKKKDHASRCIEVFHRQLCIDSLTSVEGFQKNNHCRKIWSRLLGKQNPSRRHKQNILETEFSDATYLREFLCVVISTEL